MLIVWKTAAIGDAMILAAGCDHDLAQGWSENTDIRVGFEISCTHFSIQIVGIIRLPGADGLSRAGWICRLKEGRVVQGTFPCTVLRSGFSVAWITLSDKGARGERTDESGPAIRDLVTEHMKISYARGMVIPDEPQQLKEALVDLCLHQKFDIVLTTGGTGVGPRDITPEVTLPLLDKRLEGYERVMTHNSLAKTPHGMISRAVVGTIGQAVVVNLPGSPKAVRENLAAILPALQHTVEKLQGDQRDCGK